MQEAKDPISIFEGENIGKKFMMNFDNKSQNNDERDEKAVQCTNGPMGVSIFSEKLESFSLFDADVPLGQR
jgi:hypothetical protein